MTSIDRKAVSPHRQDQRPLRPVERACLVCGTVQPVAQFKKRRLCGPCLYQRRNAKPPGEAARRKRYRELNGDKENAPRRHRYQTDADYRARGKARVREWRRRKRALLMAGEP